MKNKKMLLIKHKTFIAILNKTIIKYLLKIILTNWQCASLAPWWFVFKFRHQIWTKSCLLLKKTKLTKIVKDINDEEDIYDDKRLMAHLPNNRSTSKAAKMLFKELKACSKMIAPGGVMQDLHMLVSLENGDDQVHHGDFCENDIKK